MADKTIINGSGHIAVSKVNSKSECVLLTYTIWNFKDEKQLKSIKSGIYDLVDEDISFDLRISDWLDDDEKFTLKAKVKSCHNEKKAHRIKMQIDQFIQKKGGQTTLDESIKENKN